MYIHALYLTLWPSLCPLYMFCCVFGASHRYLAGVRIAREAVAESGRRAWVAGAVGPTGEGAGYIDDDKVRGRHALSLIA